jgi:tRNA threonylcarbamoyladenosine biosynthesis protein TsaE
VRSREPDNRVTEQASKRATEEEKSSTLNAPLEITADLEALPKVVEAMQSRIPENAIISLQGDLAAGKTTLVQAIARSLGNESAVTSPTFSLQHPYGEGLYHYDLYRVGFEELGQLGMIEEFEKPGWHLVEWMDDRLKAFLAAAGYNLWQVAITPEGDRRIYRIEPLNA